MAKTTVNKTVSVTLDLTPEEARFLRDLLQNPLGCDNPEDEPMDETEMRSNIFTVLKDTIKQL